MDYIQNTPVTLQFENCNMTQCHCIPIVDDDVIEGNELFYVTLEAADDLERDNIVLDPVNGTIEIVDSEKKCEYVSMYYMRYKLCYAQSFYEWKSTYVIPHKQRGRNKLRRGVRGHSPPEKF